MDLPIKYISSEDLENIAAKFDKAFESIKESLMQIIDDESRVIIINNSLSIFI